MGGAHGSGPGIQRVRDALKTPSSTATTGPASASTRRGWSGSSVCSAHRSGRRSRPSSAPDWCGSGPSGGRTSPNSIAELAERFEVMAELEGMAARLAARRIEREPLEELRQALEECEKHATAGDADSYYYANAASTGSSTTPAATSTCGSRPTRSSGPCSPTGGCSCAYRTACGARWPSTARSPTRSPAATSRTGRRTPPRDHVLVQVEEFSRQPLVRTWRQLQWVGT